MESKRCKRFFFVAHFGAGGRMIFPILNTVRIMMLYDVMPWKNVKHIIKSTKVGHFVWCYLATFWDYGGGFFLFNWIFHIGCFVFFQISQDPEQQLPLRTFSMWQFQIYMSQKLAISLWPCFAFHGSWTSSCVKKTIVYKYVSTWLLYERFHMDMYSCYSWTSMAADELKPNIYLELFARLDMFNAWFLAALLFEISIHWSCLIFSPNRLCLGLYKVKVNRLIPFIHFAPISTPREPNTTSSP